MKKYTKPELNIFKLTCCDIITASGTAAPSLINKGKDGEPMTESYSSLFG